MATHHSPTIITQDLALCLDAGNARSYPGTGTVWSDLSGYGRNGTISGPTHASGAFTYTGGSSNTVSVPNAGLPLNSADFTYSYWVTNTSQNGALLENGHYADGWFIRLAYQAFHVYYTGGFLPLSFGFNFNDNIWRHLTFVRRSGVIYLYIDGVEINNASMNVNIPASAYTTLSVGSATHRQDEAWSGKIAFFSINMRGLTAAEILQNYNAQKGRFLK